jgi:hypothetical protein
MQDEVEKLKIWTTKRDKLKPVNYTLDESGQKITVQKGWWFSAHE